MFSLKFCGIDCRNSRLVLTILSLAALSVASTSAACAQTLTTLTAFDGTNGSNPEAGLIADVNGNLFGTTNTGGAFGDGTVFEIAKTSSGYAGTPTTLVNFNGTNGATPYAGLLVDANGDLFGTTFAGGAFGDGTVFEIIKASSGYAGTPTTLISFNGANGYELVGGLDANGNLFGTTAAGGAFGYGTVFEIVKTSSGYAGTPTTLVNFNGTNGYELALSRTPTETYSAQLSTAGHSAMAQCSRSSKPAAAMPVRQPPWSASAVPTALIRTAA